MPPASRRVANVLVPLSLLAIAGFLLARRHRAYVRGLEYYDDFRIDGQRELLFPLLDREDILLLGWAHKRSNAPSTSYLTFPFEKPAGRFRIGVFGCSLVRGMETAPGDEFPALLQKRFRRGGYPQVEVLNFGVNAYGLHQAYLLWERLGRRYDLDGVIFNPRTIHQSRDDTFVFSDDHFGPVHARYVLRGEGVALVPPVGKTLSEACAIYQRLIPPWRYLRHDRRPPAALRALSPVGWTFQNPLYRLGRTAKTMDDQILETYRRLLLNVLHGSKRVLLYDNSLRIDFPVDSARPEYVKEFSEAFQKALPLYKAPLRHFSGARNRLMAEMVYGYLTGRDRVAIPVVSLRPRSGVPDDRPGPGLEGYAEMSFRIGDRAVASPVMDRGSRAGNVRLYPRPAGGTAFLVDFGPDVRLIPVAFGVTTGAPVALRLRTDRETVVIPLGVVRRISRFAGLLPEMTEGVEFGRGLPGGWRVESRGRLPEGFRVRTPRPLREAEVLAGGRPVLRAVSGTHSGAVLPGTTDVQVRFSPLLEDFVRLRVLPGQYFDPYALVLPGGTLDMVLKTADGRTERYPFLEYRVAYEEPRLEHSGRTAPWLPPAS